MIFIATVFEIMSDTKVLTTKLKCYNMSKDKFRNHAVIKAAILMKIMQKL